MGLGHTREDLIRAVLEDFYSLGCVQCLPFVGENPIPDCRQAAQSSLWKQILADMLDVPVFTTDSTEAACLGAAICAMIANGDYTDLATACGEIVGISGDPVIPVWENVEIYKENHVTFKKIYQANRHLF